MPRSIRFFNSLQMVVGTTGNSVCILQPISSQEGSSPDQLPDPANERMHLTPVLRAHTGCLKALSTHPNHAIAATSSSDRTIRLWDLKKRRLLTMTRIAEKGTSLVFHPRDHTLAVGTDSGVFYVISYSPVGDNLADTTVFAQVCHCRM